MNSIPSGDGTRISWQEQGSGPGVVLLHSLGTDSGMWGEQAAALANRYRLVCPDLRGHGKSEAPPGPYTLDMLGGDVIAVAEAAGLERFHLAGISLGGQIALWAAIHRPDGLLSVVLSNTAARIGSEEGWNQRIAAVRDGGLAGISQMVVGGWFSDGFGEREPERWSEAKAMFESTDAAGYIGCCGALATADLRDRAAEVSVASLVVAGEMDRATPPSDAEWLHARLPASRLEVMEGCAHLPPLEKPDEYASLLRDWLDPL